jgi:hypothetical protein
MTRSAGKEASAVAFTAADSDPRANARAQWTCNRLRHFHNDPAIIAGWCRAFGPILRWFTPSRRRLLLALGALFVAGTRPLKDFRKTAEFMGSRPDLLSKLLLLAAVFGFVVLCYIAARKFASLPALARRHPQILLHSVLWILLIVLWTAPPMNHTLRFVLSGCALFLPFLLWRLGYMMMTAQRGKMAGTRFTDHLMYIFPIWRGSDTPYGKGLDYLSANEARDERALAQSQLAGIKLLILGAIWSAAEGMMEGLIFGDANGYRRAFGGFSLFWKPLPELVGQPQAHTLGMRWLSLYLELFKRVLNWAAYGHIVIGCLRLFGFNVFRNTYKPLLAQSIVEFWNRYYYYFKELLVNFFFYPTFTRYFKKQPRMRIFAAVFMAAFVGNTYYHLIGMNVPIVTGDWARIWAAMQSRMFYCLLLAFGIYFSMLREGSRIRSAGGRGPGRRALAILGVWTFFAIINIWSHGSVPFVQRTRFFFGLFGAG